MEISRDLSDNHYEALCERLQANNRYLKFNWRQLVKEYEHHRSWGVQCKEEANDNYNEDISEVEKNDI